MELFTKLIADGLMIPIIVIAGFALLWRVPHIDRYDRYTRIFMAGITSYMLAKFIGALWQPEQLRPFEKLGVDPGAAYLDNPGFPSDHALFAAFLTIAVWYGTRNRRYAIILAVLTVIMCVGRVVALVHTPLDIVGGLVIAGLGAVWYKDYAKTRLKTHLAKKAKK